MQFEHSLSYPQLLTLPPSPPFPPYLPNYEFSSSLQTSSCVAQVVSWVGLHMWYMADLCRGYIIEENVFFLSQEPSNANRSSVSGGVGFHSHLLVCWGFVCLVLAQIFYMLSQSLCVHMCDFPVVSEKYNFFWCYPTPQLLQTFYPYS